jgi:hypothetical protein
MFRSKAARDGAARAAAGHARLPAVSPGCTWPCTRTNGGSARLPVASRTTARERILDDHSRVVHQLATQVVPSPWQQTSAGGPMLMADDSQDVIPGADAPGYPAACSLSGPLPGLLVVGWSGGSCGVSFRPLTAPLRQPMEVLPRQVSAIHGTWRAGLRAADQGRTDSRGGSGFLDLRRSLYRLKYHRPLLSRLVDRGPQA